MRRSSTVILVAIMLVFVTGTVLAAGDFHTKFSANVARQQKRIDHGIRKGDLAPSDAQLLQDNLNFIRDQEAKLKNDGMLTIREQKRLTRLLGENDRMIRSKRHHYRRLY
jgi:hypothetical protein